MQKSRIGHGLGLSSIVAVATLLASAAWCWALDIAPLRPVVPPRFTADASIELDAEGRASLAVSISVPHDALQWIRAPGGYASGVELAVALDAQTGGPGYGDVWERRVATREFAQTSSSSLHLVERRVFSAPPGRYQLRVHVQDLNSRQSSSAAARVEVPDHSRVTVGFADLMVGTVDSDGTFHPVLSRRFGPDVERLAARVVLFDRRPGPWPREYRFGYRIRDELGAETLSGLRITQLSRSAEPVVVKPDSSALFLGGYVFEVSLAEGKERWQVERSFEVEDAGPPRPRDLERLLEALAIIAPADEVHAIRAADPEDQPQAWEAFWQRRDPTPETERNEAKLEFLRRFREVSRRFKDFGPGWRTDRGRIYIRHGPPDQIENRPPTIDTPQLEVWYYHQPYKRFVFADPEGFGRFRLVDPTFE